jgi:hypothetical protein
MAIGPLPDPQLQRLSPLAGTWKADDVTRGTVIGPGTRVRSAETFGWLDGGYFLVSTYHTVFGDDPAQTRSHVLRLRRGERDVPQRLLQQHGPFTEEGNRYEGRVAAGKLTFVGPARFQYALDDDGKIKVNQDGTITVEWRLRDEGGAWQSWMTNAFSRVSK